MCRHQKGCVATCPVVIWVNLARLFIPLQKCLVILSRVYKFYIRMCVVISAVFDS